MTDVNKGSNRVEEYYELIERIHSYGIATQVGIEELSIELERVL